MNKALKTILIVSAVLFIDFGLIRSVQANSDLVVQVCKNLDDSSTCQTLSESNQSPLFNEGNFLPGDSVSRWLKVSNYSGEDQEVGIKVTGNSSNCPTAAGTLSDVLQLTIKENSNELYKDSFSNFYSAGELYLSRIENGATNVYEFSAVFLPEAGDNYQGCVTQFNFQVGFWGESIGREVEPGENLGSNAGGGGGGVFIAGLKIENENASPVTNNSATITWITNKPATSRVIYASEYESYSFDWTKPPNYGYPHSTEEDSVRKTGHSVIISNLEPGTTYYFRCVSHASPDTVSAEHSFTTKGAKSERKEKEENIEEEKELFEEAAETAEKVSGKRTTGSVSGAESQASCVCEEWSSWQDKSCGEGDCLEAQKLQVRSRSCSPSGCDIEKQTQCVDDSACVLLPKKPKISGFINSFLAAAGNIMTLGTGRIWIGILLALIIILIIFFLCRKKKFKKENKV